LRAKRTSRYDAIIVDDIGYVQQSRQQMQVLFTLLANRYERGSVMLPAICLFLNGSRSLKTRWSPLLPLTDW
jgi:DNA replication protein DnaC